MSSSMSEPEELEPMDIISSVLQAASAAPWEYREPWVGRTGIIRSAFSLVGSSLTISEQCRFVFLGGTMMGWMRPT